MSPRPQREPAPPSGCPIAAAVRFCKRPVLWGAGGAGVLFTLASLKCIVLYVLVPAVAVGWFSIRPDHAGAAEPEHVLHTSDDPAGHAQGSNRPAVPPSCPFHATLNAERRAALGPAEDADAAAAR